MLAGLGVLSLPQRTRRTQFFLQMCARQDVIIAICPSTQVSPLLTEFLDHLRKIWKA